MKKDYRKLNSNLEINEYFQYENDKIIPRIDILIEWFNPEFEKENLKKNFYAYILFELFSSSNNDILYGTYGEQKNIYNILKDVDNPELKKLWKTVYKINNILPKKFNTKNGLKKEEIIKYLKELEKFKNLFKEPEKLNQIIEEIKKLDLEEEYKTIHDYQVTV